MKCPHCRVEFFSKPSELNLGEDSKGGWLLFHELCPSCGRIVISIVHGYPARTPQGWMVGLATTYDRFLAYPRAASRPTAPREVPNHIADDYNEACLTLSDSPKAAAALGRRCLQTILRETACVRPSDLANEIQQVLDSRSLPSHLAESIDAVRNIGNFAAHPTKSTSSGEIVPVEPGEAEWTLDVLESLFDFYFVQPELLKQKRETLNKKLSDAGKPPMK